MKVQAQIRQNAEEISTYLSDLSKWEKSIKVRDKQLRGVTSTNKAPVRASASSSVSSLEPSGSQAAKATTVKAASAKVSSSSESGFLETSAARHTYDVGYKKWEKFDVDEALLEADLPPSSQTSVEEADSASSASSSSASAASASAAVSSPQSSDEDAKLLTPASVVRKFSSSAAPPSALPQVPRARSYVTNKDAELVERERGNEEFKMGNFDKAAKAYTVCLGLKVSE